MDRRTAMTLGTMAGVSMLSKGCQGTKEQKTETPPTQAQAPTSAAESKGFEADLHCQAVLLLLLIKQHRPANNNLKEFLTGTPQRGLLAKYYNSSSADTKKIYNNMKDQVDLMTSSPEGKRKFEDAMDIIGKVLYYTLGTPYSDPDSCPFGFQSDNSLSKNLDMLAPPK